MEDDELQIEEEAEDVARIDGNVTRNTSYFTLALILQKVISFTYFTLLARNLGPENLGKYYFAISFTTIFSIIMDFGLVSVITRETAKKNLDAQELLGTVIAIKLPLTLLALGCIFAAAQIAGYGSEIKLLVYLAAIGAALDSFTITFYGVIRGFHNLFFESISSVIFQLIVMSGGLLYIHYGFSLPFVFSSLTMASAFNFIYSYAILSRRIGVKIKLFFNRELLKKIALIAIPFGVFAVFQRIYTYLDSVLLQHFAGNIYVGYYQISFRIIFALQFLPGAFIASLYPAMSRYWVSNRAQLAISLEKAVIYLAIISLPISAGVVALADKIILLFKTGYGQAILPMQITILAALFVFINYPVGALLNACDRQKNNTVNMIIITIVSVALDFLLIPHFKAVGASITVLATNLLMTVLGFYWAKKIVRIDGAKIMTALGKILAAAVLMAALAFYLKTKFSIIFVVPIAAAVYLLLIVAFKTVKTEEIAGVFRSVFKKKSA
ncbi:MAG TPA: flippase [Candidatus Nanoarchaeia archaeon]|nr:flippase [Candidatus Nanoarchaeia archaeon]